MNHQPLTADERVDLAEVLHAQLTASPRYQFRRFWQRFMPSGSRSRSLTLGDCDYLVSVYAPSVLVELDSCRRAGYQGPSEDYQKQLAATHPRSEYGSIVLVILGQVLVQLAVRIIVEWLKNRRAGAPGIERAGV